jgi:hypothetical protein
METSAVAEVADVDAEASVVSCKSKLFDVAGKVMGVAFEETAFGETALAAHRPTTSASSASFPSTMAETFANSPAAFATLNVFSLSVGRGTS